MIPEGTLERFAVGVATKILGKEYKGGLFVWFSCPIETVGQALLPNWSITLETMKEPDKTSLELRGLRGGFSP